MDNLRPVIEQLKKAERALFITGAGISQESGLPTYRGVSGLYENANTEEGIPIEKALSGDMLKSNPALTWRHLYSIEKHCRNAMPNEAHKIIAQLEKRLKSVLVLTQNVDGFHHQAGSKNIIDIHGDIHEIKCTRCNYTETRKNYSGMNIPPYCPKCSHILRPDVVLFGELLPIAKLANFQAQMDRGFDIIFSIGTSNSFPYIVEPIYFAKNHEIFTVEINPEKTIISDLVDVKIDGKASIALRQIWQGFRN